ncbi:hypothetical protein Y032_0387g470 [Ancylostoma ceylanicum]|uniref:Uncharacterized protein n=1 Tax=Ancylostoma ceylanicum TaxID=53326 RepID=A0A016RSD6_9BILA|nr:hypothetical protein Y032_0387g470 [Ancylostoma ceylanicum]
MKSFSVRGIFVRPSLSKAERDRMRQERALARTSCSTSMTQPSQNTSRSDVTSVCASSRLSVDRETSNHSSDSMYSHQVPSFKHSINP